MTTFDGYQFNATEDLIGSTNRNQIAQAQIVGAMPNLSIDDTFITERADNEAFLNPESILTVIQLRKNADGVRDNVTHELRSGEWLIEDPSSAAGWSVASNQ